MLCDEEHEMLRDYNIWVKKKFMGREYMGIYRGTYLIDEKGVIEGVYDKVAVKSHAQDILKDLNIHYWPNDLPTTRDTRA